MNPHRNFRRIALHDLQIADVLHDFIMSEALPGTGIDCDVFWKGFSDIVHRFSYRNKALLKERDSFQKEIDQWHRAHAGTSFDPGEYRRMLQEIGYVVPEGPAFVVDTTGVDDEISSTAGPQLVVPVTNARYLLNAVNARWGSLYDALYGSDALGLPPAGGAYDPIRGARVIEWTRFFLDDVVPLSSSSHSEVIRYSIVNGALTAFLKDGRRVGLANPDCFRGFRGPTGEESILLFNNGLHIEIVVDRSVPVGHSDPAGVADVILEAAVTTIVDFEDSVATVDPFDKVTAYRNWLGLCNATLTHTFNKSGVLTTRRLARDRVYTSADGTPLVLPGRSLMLVRNVGLLMDDICILDRTGEPVPEGILDAIVTTLISLHDLRREIPLNSRNRAIYIVKPKLHGPSEVAFVDILFAAVEDLFGLERNTIKIGLMDEERRTTVNLKECIRAAKSRIFFINTGFLDRTGDEIRTSMEAGPVVRKSEMKSQTWIKAYEDWNVDVGLACGFPGRAQIGKGMWAMPDMMAAMLTQKSGHLEAGASTAWVPSPTAATLHATHYHRVNVRDRQKSLSSRARARLADILSLPVTENPVWSPAEIQSELENNAQGILGYVVRWVNDGTGCSKVPDIHNIGLMEDRATLRISSQHISNWLRHGIVSKDQVLSTLYRMAAIVDRQNGHDPTYHAMGPNFGTSIAFAAACDLVFNGTTQPNGYTEPLLYARRLAYKSALVGSKSKTAAVRSNAVASV